MKNEISVNCQEIKNIALDDNQKLTLSSELKPTKVYIWDKELCSGAQWEDFLKCVEEKTKENESLLDENKKLKRALKLACEKIKSLGKACVYCKAENCNAGSRCIEELSNYFIDQAEKEVKE